MICREINVSEYRRDNAEKLATQDTQDQDKNTNTTKYVLDTTICKQTEITSITGDKTRALLQTTGDKDELNIIFMLKS